MEFPTLQTHPNVTLEFFSSDRLEMVVFSTYYLRQGICATCLVRKHHKEVIHTRKV